MYRFKGRVFPHSLRYAWAQDAIKPLSGAGIQRERGVGADSNMTTDAGVMWHRFMDGKGMTIDNAGIRPFLA